MFENLSYKHKFFAVLIGFLILFLASYKKTFKHTIAAKKELSLTEEKLLNTDNLYNDLYKVKNEITALDNLIGGHSLKPEYVQQQILDFVSNTEIDINIVTIDDVHLYTDYEFLVYTNQIEFQGTYENLIHLLYDIEKNFKNSSVVSAKFHSKQNYVTKKRNLFLKIILQNYEKTK